MSLCINDGRLRSFSDVFGFRIAFVVFTGLFLSPVGFPAVAGELGTPSGPVILEIRGNIAATNKGDAAVFDLAMLEKLGLTTIRTSTVWTDGKMVFEGVLARDVLTAVGAAGTKTVMARALNEYAIDIPAADFFKHDVILATRMNGQILTARDKGPLWIVYPRDDKTELQDERIDQRWAWQLYKLELH